MVTVEVDGAYEPGQDVAVVERLDVVYLARVPHGPILVLSGTAAMIWRVAITLSPSTENPLDDVVAVVSRRYDVPSSQIDVEVRSFITDLLREGLLHQA